MQSVTELGSGNGQIFLDHLVADMARQGQTFDLGAADPTTKKTVEAFKPILDKIDFEGRINAPAPIRKLYVDKYKALVAHQIGMLLSPGDMPAPTLEGAEMALTALARKAIQLGYVNETTLSAAGGVPTWGRQLIAVISRVYPRLITPQLFPVRPLLAPEGRIYWENALYNTAFASSSPNVSVNERVDDLTKFNPDYPNKGQMGDANLLSVDLSQYIVVTADTKRLGTVHSAEAEDDLAAFNGADLPSTLRGLMEFFLQWVIDRSMINSAVTYAITEKTWNAQPTINSVAWANQTPSEKTVYNQTLWSEGVNSVINDIAARRYVYPNWVIAGSKACESLQRVSSFVPLNSGIDIVVDRTSAHDFGAIAGGTMRVIRDPQLTTNLMLFGYTPMRPMEPAIHFCPYKPITFISQLAYPRQAKYENGAYTRFAIGDPDYAQNGQSRILAECYGRLYIENYY